MRLRFGFFQSIDLERALSQLQPYPTFRERGNPGLYGRRASGLDLLNGDSAGNSRLKVVAYVSVVVLAVLLLVIVIVVLTMFFQQQAVLGISS